MAVGKTSATIQAYLNKAFIPKGITINDLNMLLQLDVITYETMSNLTGDASSCFQVFINRRCSLSLLGNQKFQLTFLNATNNWCTEWYIGGAINRQGGPTLAPLAQATLLSLGCLEGSSQKKVNSPGVFRVVSHPGTKPAQCWLTLVFKWEPVYYWIIFFINFY